MVRRRDPEPVLEKTLVEVLVVPDVVVLARDGSVVPAVRESVHESRVEPEVSKRGVLDGAVLLETLFGQLPPWNEGYKGQTASSSRSNDVEPGGRAPRIARPPMTLLNSSPTLSPSLRAFERIGIEMLRPSRGRRPWLASLRRCNRLVSGERRAASDARTAYELSPGQGERTSEPVGGCHWVKSTS